jgi:hypothetical protein
MFLQCKSSDILIKITDIEMLFNPLQPKITGRSQKGEEEQDPEQYAKQDLKFPSGEDLPGCWVDSNYRNSDYRNSEPVTS